MGYSVKEIFYTLQGEGANSGKPAVFCRFSGCNLWSGREEDRAAAVCRFCDTDFVGTGGSGGGRFDDAEGLADAIASRWPGGHPESAPFVVCTGGEPLLQVDRELTDALHRRGFTIAVETNGTVPLSAKSAKSAKSAASETSAGIDWVCVSPKAGSTLALREGDELKLPFPQDGADPESFEQLPFRHFFLQPIDGPDRERNTALALEYCLKHPRWRLSLQMHKILGIP